MLFLRRAGNKVVRSKKTPNKKLNILIISNLFFIPQGPLGITFCSFLS